MDEEEIRDLKRQLLEEVQAKKAVQHVSLDASVFEGEAAVEDNLSERPQADDDAADAPLDAEAGSADDELQRAQDELDALKTVFDDIRHQSRMSNLVTPDRWTTEGMVPEHLTSQQFVDLVYEVLACGGKAPEQHEEPEEPTDADATANDAAEETSGTGTDVEEAAPLGSVETEEATNTLDSGTAGLDEDGSEPTGALKAILTGAAVVPCTDIISMEGKETMYLYSDEVMTDTYARWAFLAAEDDRVATFVECVRQESKLYPRPMIYKALMNHPFDLTEDEVLDAWKATQETNLYPDIQSCEASNGDVYFFSTEYLTPFYAKSLAEWYSVERFMSP